VLAGEQASEVIEDPVTRALLAVIQARQTG
jgi:hypothetical protein